MDNKYSYENRKDYFLDYYSKNKEKITEIIICDDCGGKYQKHNKTSHIRTQKHSNAVVINNLKKDNKHMKDLFYEINKKTENI
ncbi:hypothetical protein BMW23_1209 [Bodo saltans virus]|uniref:Uncharacterized protein n=1 Tax=Bodo saltans virus TaxID=2024608 RepID=A0A2H4UWC9_9VIRU|nr:hypothetical protein QJ851_gp1189 [Bodo saltans virus]ATZ81252.1 hypothetical protein BMW23_1209 [Bodo saltans virus]